MVNAKKKHHLKTAKKGLSTKTGEPGKKGILISNINQRGNKETKVNSMDWVIFP